MSCVADQSYFSRLPKYFTRFFLPSLLVFGMAYGSDDYCPSVCVCKWKYNKQSVECTEKHLIGLPEGIRQETQLLDISGNNFQTLQSQFFARSSLFDLQKIYLRNCSIGQIDESAFKDLKNVVDLDLSRNLITSIPSAVFKDIINLRNLSLAHNPIQKIDPFAFKHVPALVKLDLSHCQIKAIASKAFDGIDSLENLRISDNRLSGLKTRTVEVFGGLHGIELHDNPWYCDCTLRTFKIWLVEKNIPYPIEPVCIGGPSRVLNRSFSQLSEDDFACRPEAKTKPEHRYVENYVGSNASMTCKMESIPKARVTWYWNGRLLPNTSNFNQNQRISVQESGNAEIKSTLTLINAQESDSSQFTCVGENAAGKAETNFTLRISHRIPGFAIFGIGSMVELSIALIVIIFSVLTVIVYLLFRLREMPNSREIKRSGSGELVPNGNLPQNENKALTIEPTADAKKPYQPIAYPPQPQPPPRGNDATQTLPRINDLSYRTAIFDDSSYHKETSNPDLIADTRYEDAALPDGQYTRNEVFYPSSLWGQNEIRQFCKESNVEYRMDTNDKTPIIEEVSFYENCNQNQTDGKHKRILKDCCEYPTTSSLSESTSSIPPSFASHPNAKTLRVWQKGVQVLPPVTTLKRVLIRGSDEGYLDGCGTDV